MTRTLLSIRRRLSTHLCKIPELLQRTQVTVGLLSRRLRFACVRDFGLGLGDRRVHLFRKSRRLCRVRGYRCARLGLISSLHFFLLCDTFLFPRLGFSRGLLRAPLLL